MLLIISYEKLLARYEQCPHAISMDARCEVLKKKKIIINTARHLRLKCSLSTKKSSLMLEMEHIFDLF